MSQRSKSRRKSKAKGKSVAKKVSPIPSGFRTLTPYLTVDHAAGAIDFYKKAFGAKEIRRDITPNGEIMNAHLRIGDSIIMLADNLMGTQFTSSPVTIHIYTKDVDKLWKQATTAGAKATMPLDNQFWGERYGQLEDPFGHRWSLSMQVKMSKEEKDAKMKAAMAMFSPQGAQQAPPSPPPAAQSAEASQ
jgi:PhnB protein